MSDAKPPPKPAKSRLAEALKRNIARRKEALQREARGPKKPEDEGR
jgi:hypothetical protein